jgi:PAS domain-containing protein
MKRSSALLQAAYTVCRFLVQERDLPTLLQGICDRLVGPDYLPSALLVLLDQESGGMITAETGLGEAGSRAVMAELREGRLPECGQSGVAVRIRTMRCSAPTEPAGSAPRRCRTSGALIVRAPPLQFQPLRVYDPPTAAGREPTSRAKVSSPNWPKPSPRLCGSCLSLRPPSSAEQELRRAEERYELALHASQAGLWDWNIKTGEMYTSPDQWELLDYREGDGRFGCARQLDPSRGPGAGAGGAQ